MGKHIDVWEGMKMMHGVFFCTLESDVWVRATWSQSKLLPEFFAVLIAQETSLSGDLSVCVRWHMKLVIFRGNWPPWRKTSLICVYGLYTQVPLNIGVSGWSWEWSAYCVPNQVSGSVSSGLVSHKTAALKNTLSQIRHCMTELLDKIPPLCRDLTRLQKWNS